MMKKRSPQKIGVNIIYFILFIMTIKIWYIEVNLIVFKYIIFIA